MDTFNYDKDISLLRLIINFNLVFHKADLFQD